MPSKCAETPFLKQIKKTIDRFSMIKTQDRLLAAVSGGPDSVALLLALIRLKPAYRIDIAVAHFNHMLRGTESKRDQEFCRELADRLGLDFFSDQADVAAHADRTGQSIETVGRNLRYGFFETISRKHGFTRITTGHHKDDNAEQILMNLIRGSGPEGLSGIPPVRDNRIVRPLIQVSRKEILEFLEDGNHDYVTDSSNTNEQYLRNRVRSRLIPMLQQDFNPEITQALNRTAEIFRQEDAFWKSRIQDALDACIRLQKKKETVLTPDGLAGLEPALMRRVLRECIRQVQGSLMRISHAHIQAAESFLKHAENGKSLDLPGQIRIYKRRDAFIIRKETRNLREIGREQKKARRQ